jgi:hypothetical protein
LNETKLQQEKERKEKEKEKERKRKKRKNLEHTCISPDLESNERPQSPDYTLSLTMMKVRGRQAAGHK